MESDDTLLRRYNATRDPIAFTELTRRYRALVFSAARRVTGNHHDAEDVAQTCFVELAQQANRVTGPLAGWLHVRATSRAANVARHRRRRREAEARAAGPDEAALVEATWELLGPLIDEAIELLPDELRLPVILYYLQDFGQEEIAHTLKLSQRTVSRRLRLGIEQLRKRISDVGIVASPGVISLFLKNNAVLSCPSSLRVSLAKIGISGIGPAGVKPVVAIGLGERISGLIYSSLALVFRAKWIYPLVLAAAGTVFFSTRFIAPQRSAAYDLIEAAYAPYVTSGDPLSFPAKVRSLTESRSAFWAGSQDLFYHWCKSNAADWLGDESAIVFCQGNLQLDRVGTYPIRNRPLGAVGFGLIQFDDAARLPIQIELLQAATTLRVAAADNGVTLSSAEQAVIDAALFDAYAKALIDPAPDPAVMDDVMVAGLFARAARRPYEDELRKYVREDGRFRRSAKGDNGQHKEAMRAVAPDTREAIAGAIAQAVVSSPRLAEVLRYREAGEFEEAIKDCVQRTHVDAAATQGLAKYLVLLSHPLKGDDRDMILYLKQQIPAAAERAGVSAADPRSSARRVAEFTDMACDPPVLLNGWCEIDGRSFLLQLREPFSGQLVPQAMTNLDKLTRAARILGMAAGASHRSEPNLMRLARLLTPALRQDIAKRADACFLQVNENFDSFRGDGRTRRNVLAAGSALESLKEEGN